jgi:pimeloyl-ACP methyl ester carboxylesterase
VSLLFHLCSKSKLYLLYSAGYDVFLGNFRGLASKEHVNRNISAQSYWRYSVNEHGTQDIPAMLSKIHEIKTSDLKDIKDDVSMSNPVNSHGERLPYSLCGVAHSLGGASILMYVVTQRLEDKPHYLSRLVLLSPAGFHEEAPLICWVLKHAIPMLAPILGPLIPGLYIPTRFLRGLFNKLARDFQNYPAVGGLVQTVLSYLVGGDSSNWVGAIGMSHYNMNDMPGISFLVAQHLAQMMHFKRFTMFDFGSGQANFEVYGTQKPLDIGAHYGVIDIPVDFVAGLKDKLIPRSMVRKHYEMLKGAGCKASYDEFEYAHLDFTFSHREELQAYVMSRLLLVKPPELKSGVPHQRKTVGKAKSMKRLTSSLPPKKSFKKPTIIVDNHDEVVEDKEVVSEVLGDPNQNSSQNGDSSLKPFPDSEDNPPFAMASTVQAEIESVHEHNHQDILSTVTAGSVATDSHEESCLSDEQPFEPQSFDDSSLFAFPSKELVSIMSRRVSRGGLLRGTSISEYNIERGFDTSSKVGEKVTPKLDDSSKEFRKSNSSALSRITSGFFRRSSS